MTAFAEKRRARVDRLRERAAKKHAESDARYSATRAIADAIPFGQPILVGHHSEKRSRRDAQRIQDGMRKSVELHREAKELERRAEAAAANTAISSDDPDAIETLRRKRATLEAERARWNQIAKGLRKGTTEALVALSLAEDERRTIKFSDGHVAWKAKNLGAEIRRVAKRIAELDAAASRPEREGIRLNPRI